MFQMRKPLLLLIFAFTLAGGGIISIEWAVAHMNASGVIKERMMLMKDISKSMKQIAAMMKGEVDYDSEKMSRLAKNIASKGGERITKLFPNGSLDEITEALPSIWQDWAKFKTVSGELEIAANELKAASGDQFDAMGPFQKLAQTCGACHRSFRQKKN